MLVFQRVLLLGLLGRLLRVLLGILQHLGRIGDARFALLEVRLEPVWHAGICKPAHDSVVQ
eukprot:398780-Pyramimonas_sp.AAC.1